MSKTTVTMHRSGHRLELTSPVWFDFLEEFPEKTDLNVSITRARSARQNGTYWGLLGYLATQGPEFITSRWPHAQQLSDAIQLETGYVRQIKLAMGVLYSVPESKSFEEMSQAKFSAYFEAALTKLTEWCGYEPLPLYVAYLKHKHGELEAA